MERWGGQSVSKDKAMEEGVPTGLDGEDLWPRHCNEKDLIKDNAQSRHSWRGANGEPERTLRNDKKVVIFGFLSMAKIPSIRTRVLSMVGGWLPGDEVFVDEFRVRKNNRKPALKT